MSQTERLKLAHHRATATWPALDGYRDSAPLEKMIAIARASRKERKQRQGQEQPKP